ncbi:MAG: EAL domain-containing protein [Novosphingobium sp.]
MTGGYRTLAWPDEVQISGGTDKNRTGEAGRDAVALAIALASITMFVGTGGAIMPGIVRSFSGMGLGPDKLLVSTVLLNIALIIFSWRRYSELVREREERERTEAQARILAETDPLTGCLNRRAMGPAAERLLAEASARGEAVAMFMLDIDKFKQVNDLNGHSAGDFILQESARRIVALLPPDGLIARLGGDEFACAIPFAPGRGDRVDRLAAAMVEALAQPAAVNGLSVEVTASIGLARSDTNAAGGSGTVEAHDLQHMADIAMYHAKKQGRNCYFWFEAPMESELRFRSELESGIRRGISAGEFVPYYEQQIDLKTGRLTGFEMLARWNSPTLGMVGPDIFIPVAEEIGVISELSEMLIAQALTDAKSWDVQLTLSVNISPLQLRDPWFAQRLLKMLVESNFPPNRLEIEITETCLHENVGVVRTLITSLKNQGIKVSLDDFGTGYSSLSQLRTLPFDHIKIDRSFVMSMHESSDSATIVDAITALGKGLGLPITAEGIENEEVLERLRKYGKLKGQGYLYGRPEPASATIKRLEELDLLADTAVEQESEQSQGAEAKPPKASAKTGASATR